MGEFMPKRNHTMEQDVMPSLYQVSVKQHEDWFFATCDALPGLFVGNIDYNVVLRNIPESIAMLIKHDSGVSVKVMETKPTQPTLIVNKSYAVIPDKEAHSLDIGYRYRF